jgi:site-specific recombinase
LFENKRNSVKELFLKNIGFLAYQVTEHAGRTGEHYITHDKKSYRKMLWSAMGGGFIVAFLTCFKVGIYYLRLAPFGEAFLYSMNYSLGFIGIHITHSTLATKQPAMTASKIAASLDIKGPVEDGIKNLSELIVKVFRSQFIAFMGNILVAFPVAFIVALIYYWVVGKDIAGTEKAWHMIHELHPWHSYSLFHAGIAGVCLFAAGIISGYYDNAVVFKQLPERIRNQPLLKLIMPSFILKKLSRYIENNLGSLTGNFFLGIFLGSIGTMGHFFGLPIDIRHITFASGNLGLAVASLGTQIAWARLP